MKRFARGHATGVEVHPRETFKAAILANASGLIVAHNHPSGDFTPSRDDLLLTRRLVEGGKLLGIPVLDHVIMAGPGADCRSLRTRGEVDFSGARQAPRRRRRRR